MRDVILNFLHKNALSQTYLADKISVNRQYLNEYLTNKTDSVKLEIACLDFISEYNAAT